MSEEEKTFEAENEEVQKKTENTEEAAKEEDEEKTPSRDKKVTPKKLSRKSDDAE